MLEAGDVFFTFLHLAIIGFNLFAWIWPATRKVHLVVAFLTLVSWFLLGIWYGMGYCPITDWHWQIKEKLGETDLPASFVKYYGDKLTGKDIPSGLVDGITVGSFALAIALSVYYNFFRKSNGLNKGRTSPKV